MVDSLEEIFFPLNTEKGTEVREGGVCVHPKSLQSYLTLCDPMNCSPPGSSCDPIDCSPQAPLSMGFSRQEHWSGLPCPPPGDLPDPRIRSKSLMPPASAGGFFFFTISGIWEDQKVEGTDCLIKEAEKLNRKNKQKQNHIVLHCKFRVKQGS